MIRKIPTHATIKLLLKPILLIRLIRIWFNSQILNRPTLINVDGIWFLQNWGYGVGVWAAVSGNEYESELRPTLDLIKQGQTVLDLGANIGVYALKIAQKVGDDGLVIAFEPNQKNFEKLEKNIQLNGFKNIKAFNLAAADFNGEAKLSFENNFENAASIVHKAGLQAEIVGVVRLDDFFTENNIKKIDFIKMDIEGAEPFALKGFEKNILQHKPQMLFENTSAMTASFLSKMGYRTGYFKDKLFIESKDKKNLFALIK